MNRIPETVFYYCFLGSVREERTVLVLVARGRRDQMLLGDDVPHRGMAHEHGVRELPRDLRKLGSNAV